MSKLHAPPETIWLQYHGNGVDPGTGPVDAALVSWSVNQEFAHDVAYVRQRPEDSTTLRDLWETLSRWGILYNSIPLLEGQEWKDLFDDTLRWTCFLLRKKPNPDHATGKNRRQAALWNAINRYTQACGGDVTNARISDARMNAVVEVEQLFHFDNAMFAQDLLNRCTRTPAAIREDITAHCAEHNKEVAFLPEEYDSAMLGVLEKDDGQFVVSYSKEAVLRLIERQDGCDRQTALEHFEFNIAGSHMGKGTPVFIE
jgi:hypothetical protein